MIIFADAGALDARRVAVAGPLAPLADSLAADLAPWLDRDLPLPREKARMTRAGGRCSYDGTLLAFDPGQPRLHRCPACGTEYDDDSHYRWWIFSYHLWFAERAVHAALLFALRGDARHRDFALAALDAYGEQYLKYPNRDNVLGPTRPFFSTYLESIWLLQVVAALDLLEGVGAMDAARGALLRDRVVEPSRALIASYDEGGSNRQVWNAAAIAASSLLLDDRAAAERALLGSTGISGQLARGLLADGSWYEGENYHQFAYRGLWYGVHLAGAAAVTLDPALVARFERGASIPFLTALPDLTFPARRDSQWEVSLRQWRFAEMAELGLARTPNDRVLRGALHALYDPSVPRGESQRARSTAEAERNAPGAGLARADLGWRSLVAAQPELPPLEPHAAPSLLLPDQGLAILRRDEGHIYVALDYGESGGGHGHPDRLNLLLAQGDTRWLDDSGTGSYTSDDLFWYRSALAHNAPLVDGRTPALRRGVLRAWDERGAAGWVDAEFHGAAPDVVLRRSLVVMPDYVVDRIEWDAPDDATIDLPMHVDGDLVQDTDWLPFDAAAFSGEDSGFAFLSEVEAVLLDAGPPTRFDARAPVAPPTHDPEVTVDEAELERALERAVETANGATPDRAGRALSAWIATEGETMLWRAVAPGPPGMGNRRFHVLRASGADRAVTVVWSLAPARVTRVTRDGARTIVELDTGERHVHSREPYGWLIDLRVGDAQSSIELGGLSHDSLPGVPVVVAGAGTGSARSGAERESEGDPATPSGAASNLPTAGELPPIAIPAHFELGESHWRATEESWAEAGSPRATIDLDADRAMLRISIRIHNATPHFAGWREENELDNEPPDVNSDGVQLHLAVPEHGLGMVSWLLVPDEDGSVRITPGGQAEHAVILSAAYACDATGWTLDATLDRLGTPLRFDRFRLDVLVNEISTERERRRGQLVLSGARGERAYLVGNRQSPDHYLPFAFARE